MTTPRIPVAIVATEVAPRTTPSNYPALFAARMAGRIKHPLGDFFGLANFGVNLTVLGPGAQSALRHAHSTQDEFIYVLQGDAILVTDIGETLLVAGTCAGFKAGTGDAHLLVNRSDEDFVYLEVGDRSAGDSVFYPDDDLQAVRVDGRWQFTRKDGTPY